MFKNVIEFLDWALAGIYILSLVIGVVLLFFGQFGWALFFTFPSCAWSLYRKKYTKKF